MKAARRKLEESLWVAGLHQHALRLYRFTAGRRRTAAQRAMREFYTSLIPADNALVFDIGANVGSFAEVFESLCARVISLEPNPDCVRHIELAYGTGRVSTIQAVAGPKDGLATLNLSDERDDVSSLCAEWIEAIRREHSEYAKLWNRQVTVPMVRIDTLIEHYGMPNFIKIDVEGFEESVLDGLSKQPMLTSFEFNLAYLDAAMRCLEKPVFGRLSEFNFTFGDPVRFELAEWVGKEELKEMLGRHERRDRHGDIFVRHVSQRRATK